MPAVLWVCMGLVFSGGDNGDWGYSNFFSGNHVYSRTELVDIRIPADPFYYGGTFRSFNGGDNYCFDFEKKFKIFYKNKAVETKRNVRCSDIKGNESIKKGDKVMDYFWIRQDKRYLHTPVITNLQDIVRRRKDVTIENEKEIAEVNVAFAEPQREMDFVDILDTQLFLVSERVKEVLKMYEPSILFKTVCILDNSLGKYGNYYLPVFPKIDCLSEESVITLDKSQVKRLVLDYERVECQSMFQVAGLQTDVTVIRLDVIESLLRREIKDFQFEKIEMRADYN